MSLPPPSSPGPFGSTPPPFPPPAGPPIGAPPPGSLPPPAGPAVGGLPPIAPPRPAPPTPRRPILNAFAVASLVLGLLWLLGVGAALAVIFGHVALVQIKGRGDRGRGLALAGLALGYLGLAALVAVLVLRNGDDDATSTLATSATTAPAVTAPATTVAATTRVTTAPTTVPATTTATTTASGATTTRPPFTYGTTDCPPANNTVQKRTFTASFKQCIDVNKTYTALVKTNKGDLTIKLDPKKAPGAVNNFVALAQYKFFDGVPCHRIIPSFVVQCGDPTGTGTGGPGYKFADELPKAGEYAVGSLAMANSGANTNGSQFFIVTGAQGVALPPNYTLFGQVTDGLTTTLKALDAAGTTAGVPTKEPISIVSVTITVA